MSSLAPAWMPRVTYQSDFVPGKRDVNRDIIVSIFLRGGVDGLSMCVPYGDTPYYSYRQSLAIPRPDQTTDPKRGIDLDGFFCVPPAMGPLMDIYNAGDLLFVQACGITNVNRSHFDAQASAEGGTGFDPMASTGWLGRHLASSGESKSGSLVRALALAGQMPLTLESGPKITNVADLNNYKYGGKSETEARRIAYLQQMYVGASETMQASMNNTIQTVELLKSIGFESYQPASGVTFNMAMNNGSNTWGDPAGFGEACRATAAIIKKNAGVEAVHIDYTGWDTHVSQNPHAYGAMYMQMWSLSSNLSALYRDLVASGHMGKVTIVVISEFGRNVFQNGSAGTDHGHGNTMFLIGNHVNGGRVLTSWPGLATDQLYQSNALKITIDHRDILAEVVKKRLNNNNLSTVFPGYSPVLRDAVIA